jgi:4'-phosphopantetheinyl transferase
LYQHSPYRLRLCPFRILRRFICIFVPMPVDRLVMPTPEIRVGFWKITESVESLLQMYGGISRDENLSAMAPSRLRHSLAVRLLLDQFYPNEIVVKDAFGKPHLQNNHHFISWSHSGSYAVVVACETHSVGIDIETVSNKILRIEGKFCNAQDKTCIKKTNHSESLLLIWAAKESLYKLYGKKEVDFKKDMTVEAFSIGQTGRFTAIFHKYRQPEKYTMEYEFFDGHVAVWTLGLESQFNRNSGITL